MLQLVGLVYVTTPKTKTDKPKSLLESPSGTYSSFCFFL